MRRRGAQGEKRGRKAARPKRRIGPRVTYRRGASTADLQEQLDHRTRALREALEQQTATAEILRLISSSPTDVQRVFDTIVRNFVSLCGSIFGTIFTFDGKLVHFAGAYGFSPEQLNEVSKSTLYRSTTVQCSPRGRSWQKRLCTFRIPCPIRTTTASMRWWERREECLRYRCFARALP